VWVKLGLLYRVQHPGRHLSRLQMIWRATSGKNDGGTNPTATHFGWVEGDGNGPCR